MSELNFKKLTKEQKEELTELYNKINSLIKKELYLCELSSKLKFKVFSILNQKYQNNYTLKFDFEFYDVLENINKDKELTFSSNLDRFIKQKACPIEISRIRNKRIIFTEEFIRNICSYLNLNIDILSLTFFDQMFILEEFKNKIIEKTKKNNSQLPMLEK